MQTLFLQMNKLFVVVIIVASIVIMFSVFKGKFDDAENKSGEDKRSKYQYKRKNFFMTRAEHECYDALIAAVGNDYFVFAQVHLPTLVDNKIKGQNWRGAFKHISEKSVDFVLCDKNYISPKLVIELDDRSHERPERQERDKEVERILQNAGLPLLRLENRGHFNQHELAQKIRTLF